jgi:ubiquinone biosynthesis protein
MMLAKVAHLFGIARAGLTLARNGAFSPLDPRGLPPMPALALRGLRLIEKPEGQRDLSKAIQKLGPSHIKLGQFLATRPDVVGKAIAAELSELQDRLPPFSMDDARRTLNEDFGDEAEALFGTLGEPIAAASIAQVHKAEIEGRPMAVKILRPAIDRIAARDFRMFYTGAHLAQALDPEMQRLRIVDVIADQERVARFEMDLRMEAAAIEEIRKNTAEDPGFRVPHVDWRRSSKRVLTTEWIDGVKLTDFDALEAAGHDRIQLADSVMQSFLRHAMRDGVFHADMHPGNLFVEPDGTIVAIDFGIIGRLNPRERRFLAEILWGYIKQDYRRAAEVHFEAGYVPSHHSVDDFAQALRAIGTPILDASASDISMGRLLTQLFEVTELFDMQTRTELILLQKTMVVVEGLSRELNPSFNMWKTSEPVIGEWIARNLGPAGQLGKAAEAAGALGTFVGRIPELVTQAEDIAERLHGMSRDGLRLDAETAEKVAAANRKASCWQTIALWVGAISLVFIAIGGLG